MKKRMKRFKNRRTTSTAAILCMAALLFAVLLAGCSVQKETEASGDQQQETWSEEMENSTALSEEPDDTDTIGNADNPEDTGDIGNPENPEDTSTALTLPILDEINSKVQIGTSGSSLIAVQAAVKLLEWGEHTGLDPEEIREAASAWLSEQTDSDREEALLKLEMVDDAYQRLLKEDARELRDARIRRFSGEASLWSRLRQLCRQPDCERTKPLMLAQIFSSLDNRSLCSITARKCFSYRVT